MKTNREALIKVFKCEGLLEVSFDFCHFYFNFYFRFRVTTFAATFICEAHSIGVHLFYLFSLVLK